MRDDIIEEVEKTREEIARRYDFDVKKIFRQAKKRAAERRKQEAQHDASKQQPVRDAA